MLEIKARLHFFILINGFFIDLANLVLVSMPNHNHVSDQDEVLIITEKGYGKRTMASEYPTKGRGGKGIKTANITEKNGPLAGLLTVKGDEDLMIITDTGVMIRTSVGNISQTGRSTQGVKVMRLDQDAKIVTFTTVQPEEKDEEVVEENE